MTPQHPPVRLEPLDKPPPVNARRTVCQQVGTGLSPNGQRGVNVGWANQQIEVCAPGFRMCAYAAGNFYYTR